MFKIAHLFSIQHLPDIADREGGVEVERLGIRRGRGLRTHVEVHWVTRRTLLD